MMETEVRVSEATPLFLIPTEAISRLDEITSQLRERLDSERLPKFLAAEVCYLAFLAQKKILGYLNDENFFCRILWDPRTNLPSHPSLTADVAKCGETFNMPSGLRALLNSFSCWTVLQKEELKGCVCSGKSKTISIEVMTNTILRVQDNGLAVKLLIGVRADDQSHLEKHYNIKKQSRASDGLIIIFTCENRIVLTGEGLTVESVSYSSAETFSVPDFEKMIQDMRN